MIGILGLGAVGSQLLQRLNTSIPQIHLFVSGPDRNKVSHLMNRKNLINFCDNFDSYNSGDPIAQISSSWNTWGELMNGVTAPFSDDAQISSVMSYSGDYSLYLNDATGQGRANVSFDLALLPPSLQRMDTKQGIRSKGEQMRAEAAAAVEALRSAAQLLKFRFCNSCS